MKPQMTSQSDLVKEFGKTKQAISKAFKRAGLRPNKKGLYDRARAIAALASGELMDKNQAKKDLTRAASSGIDPADVRYKTLEQKLRQITLQCEILETERDKANGELISKPDHIKQLLAMQTVCISLIDQWIANVSAKRADATLLADLRKCRDSALVEIEAIRGDE